jgi:hypothetical protein
MSTLTDYRLIARDLTRWQQITNKKPMVAQQTKYFQANIGNIKTIDAFLKNTRLFNFAMQAFGMGDRLYAKGLMKKVLEQGVADSNALANKLNDPRIKAFAKAFDFAGKGASATQSDAVQKDVAARFVEQTLQADQGASNPGVRLALYFRQNAPNITSTLGLLADRDLLQVAQMALGISPLSSHQDVDLQAKNLAAKVDVADFKDARKLQKFIERFCAAYDVQNGSLLAAPQSQTLALFDTSSPVIGIGLDAMLSLQTARLSRK